VLCCAIASEVAGTLFLRQSEGVPKNMHRADNSGLPYLSFAFVALTLTSGVPVGIGNGGWAAPGMAFTSITAGIVCKEPPTPIMGVGIIAIIVIEIGGHT
jgi:small multidrug resistance pump